MALPRSYSTRRAPHGRTSSHTTSSSRTTSICDSAPAAVKSLLFDASADVFPAANNQLRRMRDADSIEGRKQWWLENAPVKENGELQRFLLRVIGIHR